MCKKVIFDEPVCLTDGRYEEERRFMKAGREYSIPFEVPSDPFYSESNTQYLEGIMQDVKEGKAHFAEHGLIEADE